MKSKLIILNYTTATLQIVNLPEGITDIEEYLENKLDLSISSISWMIVDHIQIDLTEL